MSDKKYWVWLNMAFGAGRAFKDIVEHFGSAKDLYESTFPERCRCPGMTYKLIEDIDKVSLTDAEKVIDICEKNSWDIITYDDPRYPQKLKNIYDPPAVLYVDGRMPDFDRYATIGVVGTRKASRYAVKISHLMAKGIAECNAIVISGGALGVDTAAHNGALDANGITVAVLGCGFGANYLVQNEELRHRIKVDGALLTEFPPYTTASRYTFPIRNRIISALSDGVLVAEAGVKSGSLITAEYALKQNRDIFAVPASLLDENFLGTNKLIDEGAMVATSPHRILSQYISRYNTLDIANARSISNLVIKNDAPKQEQISFDTVSQGRDERLEIEGKALKLTGDNLAVYSSISEEYVDIDTICTKCALPINTVLVVLTMLELEGLVESAAGKRYKRK